MSDKQPATLAPNKGGNFSPFRPEYVEIARAMCRMGATDMELADHFEVTRVTIHNWRLRHPEFEKATRVGKSAYDSRIERALAERAAGYSFTAQKVVKVSGGKDVPDKVEVVEYTEHMPSDPASMIFWLKNRKPKEWRDKQPDDAPAAEVRVVVEGGLPREGEKP